MSDTNGSPSKSPVPKPRKVAKIVDHPKTIDMVLEAIGAQTDRKGASVPYIKSFILEKYKSVDPNMLKSRLKKAIEKGMADGAIVRPKASEQQGVSLNGRFKLDKAKMNEKTKKPKEKSTKEKPEKKTLPKKESKTKLTKSPKKAVKSKTEKAAKSKPPTPKAKAKATAKIKTPKKTPIKIKRTKASAKEKSKGTPLKKIKTPKTTKTKSKTKSPKTKSKK